LIIPKDLNRLIGKAMHAYSMLTNGDRILVAVSGGVDSLVLAAILALWRNKAPIDYELVAVHLDMGFPDSNYKLIAPQLAKIPLNLEIEHTSFGSDVLALADKQNACFACSRNRRTRLFSIAREKNCNKLAFGHHKDDIIETFFLNVLYGGNISTMVPSQVLFSGNLTIIRPLAFLEKKQVRDLAVQFDLQPTVNPCPLEGETKRDTVRQLLEPLYQKDSHIKGNIFSALANVRTEYLLKKTKKK